MNLFDFHGCEHDLFISYATADNDRYANLVDDIQEDLKKKLGSDAAIRKAVGRDREPAVFRDQDGLPPAGGLNAMIRDAVDKTAFLLLLVSQNYLDSDWCFKELEHFRQKLGGKRDEALERLFIVVIEKGAEADGVARVKEVFGGDDEPRFMKFYDQEDEPLRRNHESYDKLLRRCGSHMAKIYASRRPKGSASAAASEPQTQSRAASKVLLGCVTDDLNDSRDRLRASLEEGGIETASVEKSDLLKPDALRSRIDRDMVFVQLVSFSQPLLPFMPGGHIEAQLGLLRSLGDDACPRQTLICYPEREPGVVEEEGAEPDNASFVNGLLDGGTANACCRSLAEVAARLKRPEELPETCAIFVEYTEADAQHAKQLTRDLKEIWKRKYPGSSVPSFTSVPWEHLKAVLPLCSGIILLYGKKQPLALTSQVLYVEKTLEELKVNREPWMRIAVEPSRASQHTIHWDTFPYESADDSRLESVVDELYRSVTTTGGQTDGVRPQTNVTMQ